MRAEPGQTLADGRGRGAADAGIRLVEDQGRRRAARGEHDFQRQDEARQLAAGGDLHHGAGLGAGIGGDPEGDAVDAAGAALGQVHGLDMGDEARLFELQRREFRRHLGVEALGGGLPRALLKARAAVS